MTDDIPAALANPVNRAAYLVVTDAVELQDALAWPMDRWRIYLHPSQRSLAQPLKPYSGPARVTGGPGTGKTVVAVHRAVALARSAQPGERVLLTTFGNTLARALEELLVRLGGEAVRDRVDVLTTDKLARRVLTESGRTVPSPLSDEDCLAVLRARVVQVGTELDPQLLRDEWYRVILDQDVTSKENYLATRRPRLRRLSTRQKEQVWEVLAGFTEWLAGNGLITFPQIINEAATVASGWRTKPYRHVIVDEAQDMTAGQWRLLRAVAPEASDDMFLVGDAHQRIYGRHVVLSHHGIHTRGRSRRLTLSYRTTLEIARGGLALLKGHHYDDLDAGEDTLDSYRALIRGPAPTVVGYPSLADELAALADQVVVWREAGVAAGDIAVGVRTHYLVGQVISALAAREVPVSAATHEAGGAAETVHVMTLHRLKGLEYRCVAVAGMSEGAVPPAAVLAAAGDDPQARRAVMDQERALVFVAATRPREALRVSWHGQPSPLILPLVMLFHSPSEQPEAPVSYDPLSPWVSPWCPRGERDAGHSHPLLSSRRNIIVVTRQVFGDYIDIYDLTRAVEDGATVRVFHESRLIPVDLPADVDPATIDDRVNEVTVGLDDAECSPATTGGRRQSRVPGSGAGHRQSPAGPGAAGEPG